MTNIFVETVSKAFSYRDKVLKKGITADFCGQTPLEIGRWQHWKLGLYPLKSENIVPIAGLNENWFSCQNFLSDQNM
jgi:hypothetical protein